MTEHRNRLAAETSPYLLQHADNPVDWHPWTDQALALARDRDKPVLLSIGYSACHWCHVMAHESFENEQIASLMNELFVNIKVDREERPDLDKIYQTAHQLLAQRPGGWPLTVFLDPHDQLPFFAGTYFPPEPRHGMPGFAEVLRRVADFYRAQRSEIDRQKEPLRDVFRRIEATELHDGALDDSPIRGLRRELADTFDARHGGFGGAPKFPHPASIERLLSLWAASRGAQTDDEALRMAEFTLEKMIRGGLYDQLGGGFYRYSVDARWEIPHFEKMLYDNGPLLGLCAAMHAATGRELFADAAHATAHWVMREMQAPEGGYYATLDADSEGEEGKFYVWDAAEARAIVGDEAWPLVAAYYGLDASANFEGSHHLQRRAELGALGTQHGLDAAAARARIDTARSALLEARAQRVRPGRDEKILTSWNALMIRGMAIAARELDTPGYAESATRAVDFIRSTLWRDGRLLATYKDGRARFDGYLDDYAHLADALIELLRCRWRTEDLDFAIALADALLAHFENGDDGGFYFTSDEHEQLFHRSRPFSDDATPAGNGTATRALIRLGYLLGNNRYLEAAERALRAAWDGMRRSPSAHATMVDALAEHLDPPAIVIARGSEEALAAKAASLQTGDDPLRLVFAIPSDVDDLPEPLAVRAPRGDFVAYVCRGHTCTVEADE